MTFLARTPHCRRRNSGISLIEVLVSLVILSLGVLAVVALQLVSKRNNSDAGQRTIAAQLAFDVTERMRANSTAAALYAYTTGSEPLGRGSRGATEPTPNCRTSACTEAQLVIHDHWEIEQALDGAGEKIGSATTGGLLLPTACINGPSTGDGLYDITIVWRGKVAIPDTGAGTATAPTPVGCGRNVQVGGEYIYGENGNNDRFRRSVTLPVYITARRRTT